ncbi:RAVE protein 1 C terminal-domain-containing protein [Fimicolochytrium jonesii]|uniref:RAVE protein 1 C terminal-domain-containing protein n=1 Tax=Fimicolochytrium jonesii TaxID=1396493 RepID=UPI0022FE0B3C|nr:RAVE protein 1 C terminal-domain-containing protein [Fimicolochytrium jonesii]KAI8818763.1 RAVE protein 1 C terminal-domain-containing protein [Fimicolochytrium jonesii]
MQLLQQVVGAKSNATLTDLATGCVDGERYVAYGSGESFVIYTAEKEYVQTLSSPSGGGAIAWTIDFGPDGRIAAAFGNEVVIFFPTTKDLKCHWLLQTTLGLEFEVRAISWSAQGQLLVGGDSLTIWREGGAGGGEEPAPWTKAWECRTATETCKARFSPDGFFFATTSENDSLVKVWCPISSVDIPGSTRAYDFSYLDHPSPVVLFVWRRPQLKSGNKDENVLMTLSKDNVTRLWCLSRLEYPYQFQLGAVIDPSDFPLTEAISTVKEPHICSVHWLHGAEIHQAIAKREKAEARFLRTPSELLGNSVSKTKKLKSALSDYSDVLLHIQSDGSAVIWGIQNLTSHPRRIPKVLVIMKTEHAVPVEDVQHFEGQSLVFFHDRSIQPSTIFQPAELQIVVQRSDGALNSYIMDLDDFFTSSWMVPRLAHYHSWNGHRKAVHKVIRHPRLPYVATIAKDAEVMIFRSSAPQMGLRTTDGLSSIATIPPEENVDADSTSVVWLPHGLFFVLQQVGKLTVYTLEGNKAQSLGDLPSKELSEPLAYVHAYVDADAKAGDSDAGQSDAANVFLVGIAKRTGQIQTWSLRFERNTLQFTSLIHSSELNASTGLQPSDIFLTLPTDDLSLSFYPHSPLGAHIFLTYSSDKRVRFWHCGNGSLASLLDTGDGDVPAVADEAAWRVVAEFDIDAENVSKFETDAFGKMAIVSSFESGSDLSIWSNEATGLEMKKEWSTKLTTPIVALDWFMSSDGQHLLVIGTANRVAIYSQCRLVFPEDPIVWEVISSIDLSWQETTTAVSWLPNGSLMVATTLQVRVYDKWIQADEQAGLIAQENASDTRLDHIFTVVDDKNGRLPDHHPHLLMQYLLWGKFDFVRYSLSLLYHFVKLMSETGKAITETPMPLWKFFAEEDPDNRRERDYDSLFGFDEDGGHKEPKVGEFPDEAAAYLSEKLATVSLPNVTGHEQMLLLAVIDTFVQVEKQKRSMDENGVRYMLFMRLFMFSQTSLPSQSKRTALTSRDIVWAFFSESQDSLLEVVTQACNNKVLWSDAKSLGLGYWLRNPETMRKTMETIARNQYMGKDDTRNPVDCALFYIALKKKNVLLGLWKLANSHPEQAAMLKFLGNDFEEERWRSAAMKNAFALLGKQRYENSVAFFLLADKLKDAVSVCLKQLNDPQLAIILCRLYEGEESKTLKETLLTSIIPSALEKGDRWLASMGFTLLKDKDAALLAILEPLSSLQERLPDPPTTALNPQSFLDPTLVLFYHHLRRSYRTMRYPQPRIPRDLEGEFVYRSAQAYERLGCPGLALDIIRKADALIGQYIGDEAIVELKAPPSDSYVGGNLDFDAFGSGSQAAAVDATPAKAGDFDWGAPASSTAEEPKSRAADFDWGAPAETSAHEEPKAKASDFDWGAPATPKKEDPPSRAADLDWGAPASQPSTSDSAGGYDWGAPASSPKKPTASDSFDWGAPSSPPPAKAAGGLDWGEPVANANPLSIDDEFEAFKKSMGGGYGDDEDPEEADENLDDDQEVHATSEAAADENKAVAAAPPMDDKTRLRFELEQRNMRLYKWILAMRIVQAVYKSVTIVSRNRHILSVESTFRDYTILLVKGIQTLLEIVQMPVDVMDQVLTSRCREMDAIVAYGAIIPLRGTLQDYGSIVELFLLEKSNVVAKLAFGDGFKVDARVPGFTESLSRQLLLFLTRWFERVQSESVPDIKREAVSQAAITAYLTMALCALRSSNYALMNVLMGSCDRIFDGILSNRVRDLGSDFMDIVNIPVPKQSEFGEDDDGLTLRRVDTDPDEDDFEGDSLLKQELPLDINPIADSLMVVLFFQHIALTFQAYLAQLRKGNNTASDEEHRFLVEGILTRMSTVLFDLQRPVANRWKKGGIKPEKVRKYLDTDEKKRLWDTIRKTVSVGKMLHFVKQARDEEVAKPADSANKLDDFGQTPAEETEAKPTTSEPKLVYRTKDIIHTFAMNPLDHNQMAIGTHRGILEVDIANARQFFQRRGTFTDIQATVDDISLRETAARNSLEGPRLSRTDDADAGAPNPMRRGSMVRNLTTSNTDLNGSQLRHTVPGVSSLASHPTLNYYLAGISDPPTTPAVVQLYQFGQAKELVTYTSGTTARFTRTRFDPFGARFGGSDSKGDVYLWRFDASADASTPAMVLGCHSLFTNDFTFLNSSTLLASAGVSTNNQNVCLWDTLLPASKARVGAFTVAESGAYSVAYSARHQLLFSGSKKGDIYIFDMRQRALLDSFHGHDHLVKTLCIDVENGNLVSGSMGGHVKLWDLQSFKEKHTWSAIRDSPTPPPETSPTSERAGLTPYGIMQAEVVDNTIYACGADGCVRTYEANP